jgi:hypothetical protein
MHLLKTPTPEAIENKIMIIRNKKVILDRDLALFYNVQTRALTQAVKRNIDRFPDDFMFQLSNEEFQILKSQIVTSSWGGTRKLPYVFTQEGIAMLSSVLRSKQAIYVNIQIMRVFVKIREFIYTHKELAQKINQLERKYDRHDYQIQNIFDTIRNLPVLEDEKQIAIEGFKKK